MKKYIFILGTIFISTLSLGQSNVCLGDTTAVGRLINNLLTDGVTSITISKTDNTRPLNATRLCEHQYTVIDSLDKLLTNEQVDDLVNCENGTLTAVGFIIFCNRTGDKSEVLEKLESISKAKYRIISNGCSDAIQTLTLGQYCMNILTQKNGLLRRPVKLTKRETEKIKGEIKASEKRHWNG
jgi:hypothetical protein